MLEVLIYADSAGGLLFSILESFVCSHFPLSTRPVHSNPTLVTMENVVDNRPTGIEDTRVTNKHNDRNLKDVKVFCTCEGAVVAVHAKPEHEKREYSLTETEVLGSDFGESIRTSDFELKWDGFNDPDNPRSMAPARKWLIIIILASVSLCS
jgi:hypothetical protein